MVCSCDHLMTDFGAEVVDSLASSVRVIGQLNTVSENELAEKVETNLSVVLLVFGFLLISLCLCFVSTMHYKRSRLDARRLVHRLAADITASKREHGQRRLSMATPTKKSAASAAAHASEIGA